MYNDQCCIAQQNSSGGVFMQMVLLTALGVGGATVIGAVLGFCFQKISHRFSDIVLSFAAGVMLAAMVWSLLLPAMEMAKSAGVLPWLPAVTGFSAGVWGLLWVDHWLAHRPGGDPPDRRPSAKARMRKGPCRRDFPAARTLSHVR